MVTYKHVELDWRQFMFGFARDGKGNFVCIGPVTFYFETK